MFIEVKNHANQTPKININLIVAVIDKQVHFAGGLVLDLDDESIEKINNIIEPKEKKSKPKAVNQELLELFNELHKLTKGTGKPTFSVQREKKLKFLLDPNGGRLTKEKLIVAATNIGNDKFLQGDNDGNGGKGKRYGDIDYLLRPDKAARYADEEIKIEKKGMF